MCHSFWLHGLWWEICCHSCFFLWIRNHFSFTFKICLKFSEVWLWWVLVWPSLGLTGLGSTELLESAGFSLLPFLGSLQPLFLQLLFQLHPFFSLSEALIWCYGSLKYFYFFKFISSVVQIGNFYSFIFKFTDSFLSPSFFKFYFSTPNGSFYFPFLCWNFVFTWSVFIIAWQHFYNGCF